MSDSAPATQGQGDLAAMRRVVVEWLRKDARDTAPGDNTLSPDSEPNSEAVLLLFLLRASAAGFACEIGEVQDGDGGGGYEARWTHQGASFVGFKQASPQATPDMALLAGCAALLANEWCRSRL